MSSNLQRSEGVHSLPTSDEIWLKNKVRTQLLDLGGSVVVKWTKLFVLNNGGWEEEQSFSLCLYILLHEQN